MHNTFILEIGGKIMVEVFVPIIWPKGMDFGAKLGTNEFLEYRENGSNFLFGF